MFSSEGDIRNKIFLQDYRPFGFYTKRKLALSLKQSAATL